MAKSKAETKPVRNAYRQGKVGITVYLAPDERHALGVAAALSGQKLGEFVALAAIQAAIQKKREHGLDQ